MWFGQIVLLEIVLEGIVLRCSASNPTATNRPRTVELGVEQKLLDLTLVAKLTSIRLNMNFGSSKTPFKFKVNRWRMEVAVVHSMNFMNNLLIYVLASNRNSPPNLPKSICKVTKACLEM